MPRMQKTRFSIALTPKIYEALVQDSKDYGVSLTAYCSFLLGQHYSMKEKMLEMSERQVEQMRMMRDDLNKF